MNTMQIVQYVADAANDKKAQGLTVLDVQQVASFADYFLICHGQSSTQVQAIVNGIKEKLHKHGLSIYSVEGYRSARWVLVDIGDIVVHVFHRDERTFYNLERLWGDAKLVPIQVT